MHIHALKEIDLAISRYESALSARSDALDVDDILRAEERVREIAAHLLTYLATNHKKEIHTLVLKHDFPDKY